MRAILFLRDLAETLFGAFMFGMHLILWSGLAVVGVIRRTLNL